MTENNLERTNETPDPTLDVLSLPHIVLSNEAYKAFRDADPYGDDTIHLLETNNAGNAEAVIVVIDGESRVVSMSPDDFGTTMRHETDKLHALLSESTDGLDVLRPEDEAFEIQEGDEQPRLKKLFEPLLRPHSVPIDYDLLFSKDQTEYEAVLRQANEDNREIGKAQQVYDRFVTPVAEALAAERLEKARMNDRDIDLLIKQLIIENNLGDPVVALRENAAVRYRVGMYLLHKIDQMAVTDPGDLPERILRNGQKRTDSKELPVDYYTSREYVAFLALAKLDGSFNPDRQLSMDDIVTNDSGEVVLGQHRYAADLILDRRK